MHIPRFLLPALCAIPFGALPACSSDLTMRMHLEDPIRIHGPMMTFEGTYISDQLFERIKINESREDWVVALLGDPTMVNVLDNGTEVWKWVYREMGFNTSVIEIANAEDEPTLPQMLTFVLMRNGVVIDKWRG